ncbi:DUF1836 domain-containing protein [Metabacillus herbersteinensis]|uniref:DUF1836 domain-containing protein n=1 Tax=Metabacillus herbersteinensis TaxID=283816 RepID=A0ABV6GIL0_9BACI
MNIQLTRKQMTRMLYSLKGDMNNSPTEVIHELFGKQKLSQTKLHSLLKKLEKKRIRHEEFGLSTNEIVTLANMCELTSLKSTSIQNWIKRDVKELIGAPDLGKKYSIDQVAILLIVRDLKAVFDFETIRNLLTIVFNNLSDRSDDLVSPIVFYETYSTILDQLERMPGISVGNQVIEEKIIYEVELYKHSFLELTTKQWNQIRNILVMTILAVLTSHIQTRALSYLQNLHNED